MVRYPTQEEWKRVSYHAKMIRCLYEETIFGQTVDESVLYAMFSLADGYLFPNLRRLAWPFNGTHSGSSMYLANFISPTLEKVTIAAPCRVKKVVMDSLRACLSLKAVTICDVAHSGALVPLRQILLQSPQLKRFTFAFPLEPSHVAILGSMEGLRDLNIQLTKSYNWSKLLPANPSFRSLKTLYLQFDSLQQAIDFLGAVFFCSVTTVSIFFKDTTFPPPPQVERLATSISIHFSKDSLSDITISSKCSPRLPWDTSKAIRPLHLAPFLSLPNISGFEIEANWCYDLDNELLRNMALAWPNLEALRIAPFGSWPRSEDCRITLYGLLPFVEHCPKISSVHCRIEGLAPTTYDDNGEATDVDDHRHLIHTEGLQYLSVGDSKVTHVENAAVFISKLCPWLEVIYAWEDVTFEDGDVRSHHLRNWYSVQCWAKRLGAVRREEGERTRDELLQQS